MNCLEVRRKILVEPDCVIAALQTHLDGCAGCREFVRRQQQMEARLQIALDVPLPDGLAARSLLRQSLLRKRQQRRSRWQAMAAALVLLFAGLAGWQLRQPVDPLGVVVLAHINQELKHLHDQQSLNLNDINHLLQPWGMKLPALPAKVNYAGVCPVGRARAVHLVVDVQNQPVTLLLLPDLRITKPQRVGDSRFVGEIVPFGEGSIAIVGESAVLVKQLEHRMASLVPEYL
jgi:hypothetical protein